MSIYLLFVYFVAGIILFFILNYFNKRQKSLISSVLVSVIYIILVASILQIKDDSVFLGTIFFIVIFELLIRIFYVSCILEQDFLKNYLYEFQVSCFSCLFSYLVNYYFISKIDQVFPTIEEVRIIIWGFIVIYFVYLLKDKMIKINSNKKKVLFYQDKEYIVIQYAKLKNQYSSFIHLKNIKLVPLIYAIMIYENYYRPKTFRKVDEILYRISHRGRRFGIMQVYSKKILTDVDSIKICIKKLEKIYSKLYRMKKRDLLLEVLRCYYHRKDVKEIWEIYLVILEFTKRT